MRDYRLYHLNSDDRIVGAHGFRAESDEVAIWQAQDAANGGTAELWCGSRRVRRWAGKNPQT